MTYYINFIYGRLFINNLKKFTHYMLVIMIYFNLPSFPFQLTLLRTPTNGQVRQHDSIHNFKGIQYLLVEATT